jgi:LacI family transcriptional regulator
MSSMNFKPNALARGLARGQSMTIGVVTQTIGSPFYAIVAHGVIAALTGSDYFPIFVDGQWQTELETAAIKNLLDRQVDGIIVIGGNLKAEQLKSAFGKRPFVLVAQTVPGFEDRCIRVDNVAAGYLATEHLLKLGHRQIAHLLGIPDHRDAQDRLAGYRQALQDYGVEFCQQLVIQGSFDCPSGVEATEKLLDSGQDFTAIFAANDEMAFGAQLALHRRKIKVPEQVSVIGIDDQYFSAFQNPPLTTVAQPAAEMGAAAAGILIKLINGEKHVAKTFPVELVVRESTSSRV